jgi:hypothetical protein
MRLYIFFLASVIGMTSLACASRKPAYSNINTNQPERTSAENGNEQPASAASKIEEVAKAAEAQQPPASPQAQPPGSPQPDKNRFPSFLDQAKGEIRDLPSYPNATRLNLQYGSTSGYDTMVVALHTGDPVSKIAAFYDKAIKSNGWTVTATARDDEAAEWSLKKGDNHEGVVKVLKDTSARRFIVSLHRFEKLPGAPK